MQPSISYWCFIAWLYCSIIDLFFFCWSPHFRRRSCTSFTRVCETVLLSIVSGTNGPILCWLVKRILSGSNLQSSKSLLALWRFGLNVQDSFSFSLCIIYIILTFLSRICYFSSRDYTLAYCLSPVTFVLTFSEKFKLLSVAVKLFTLHILPGYLRDRPAEL